ncbi:MAG: phage terminase large subunit family protein [Bilophila wadsworthia]|nr:phage terminase large subunit family protein [Bilophila wadsworthia]
MRRQKWLPSSQWAERYRMVRMSSLPGLWQNVFTPYLVGVMDAARFPGVEVVILCKTPQTGGSEAALNVLAQMIDLSPGPAMVVFPDEITAKENAKDRILPMLQDSRHLRGYLSGAVDDASSIRINLKHMPIYLGWSGSVSRLGNKPIRILVLDELDKYQNPRKEATSESLAEKRTISWKERKFIFKLSTPTTEDGPVWTAYTEEAHARFEYHVICPCCGAAQLMRFDQIRWPEGERDPEKVLAGRLAVYQCEHCGGQWSDADRDRAVRKGFWVEKASGLELFAHLHQHRPAKIGFHLPAWNSYFVSLSEVAHAFLKWKKTNRLEDLKNFMNQYKAEPWKEVRAERQEDGLLALCDMRPRGVVPAPLNGVPRVAALVAGVDTQAKYFRYVIRAFAPGDTEESWLIQCGTAPTFESLSQTLWRNVYRDAEGNEYRVSACVIDAMGAPGRTKQVYAWCAQQGGRAMPFKGEQKMATPVSYSPIEFFPDAKGSKIKIPGGVLLRRVDTTFFKGDLAEKLSVTPGDPGTFWLHANTVQQGIGEMGGILADYAKEMCAEVFSPEKLIWENPHQRPNHFWDCEVMALVCAWELGIRNWETPDPEPARTEPAPMAAPAVPMPMQRPAPRSLADRLARLRR